MKIFFIQGFILFLVYLTFTTADEFESNFKSFNGEAKSLVNKDKISPTEDIKENVEIQTENFKAIAIDDSVATQKKRLTDQKDASIDIERQSNYSNVDLNHFDENSKNEFLNHLLKEQENILKNKESIEKGEVAEVPNILKEEIIKQYLMNEMYIPPIPSENVQQDEKQKVIRHLLSNAFRVSENLKYGDKLSDKTKLDEQKENNVEEVGDKTSSNGAFQSKKIHENLDNLIKEDIELNEKLNEKDRKYTSLITDSVNHGNAEIKQDIKDLIDKDYKLKEDVVNYIKHPEKSTDIQGDLQELVNQDIKLKKDLIEMENDHANLSSNDSNKNQEAWEFLTQNSIDKDPEKNKNFNLTNLELPNSNINIDDISKNLQQNKSTHEEISEVSSPLLSLLKGENEQNIKSSAKDLDNELVNGSSSLHELLGSNKVPSFESSVNSDPKEVTYNGDDENKGVYDDENLKNKSSLADQVKQIEKNDKSNSGEDRKINDLKVPSALNNFEESPKEVNKFEEEMSTLTTEVQEEKTQKDEKNSISTKEEGAVMSLQIGPPKKNAVNLNETFKNLTQETAKNETTYPTADNILESSNSNNTPDTLVAVPNNLNLRIPEDNLNKSSPESEPLSTSLPELTIEQVNSLSDQDLMAKLEENQKLNPEMLKRLNDPNIMHEILSSSQRIPYVDSNPLEVSSTDSKNLSDSQLNSAHFTLPVAELLESNPLSADKETREIDPKVIKSMSDAELQVALISLLASMNPTESNQVNLHPTGYGTFSTYINDIDLNVELVPIQSNPLTRKKAKDYFKDISKTVNNIHSKMPPGTDEVVKAVISATVPGGSEAIVAGEFIAKVMKEHQEKKKKRNDPSVA